MFYHSTGHLNTEAAERRIEELVRDPNVEVWFDGDMIYPKPVRTLLNLQNLGVKNIRTFRYYGVLQKKVFILRDCNLSSYLNVICRSSFFFLLAP